MDKKLQNLSSFIVPIAIVIGGIMVSGAIFASQQKADDTDTKTGTNANTEVVTDAPKSDKPVVELFVMSHCPYGTMAEKGIIPAVKALGDKIDFKIRFVYYAMHGEKEVYEQLNQYCIQKDQPEKYISYLEAFLADSDSANAMTVAGIDQTSLNECAAAVDAEFGITASFEDKSSYLSGSYPLFNTDKTLNAQYGVQGSPTLVINGAQVSSGRDSASYLAAICSAFNTTPEECTLELSSVSPSAGFGYGTSTGSTEAQCN